MVLKQKPCKNCGKLITLYSSLNKFCKKGCKDEFEKGKRREKREKKKESVSSLTKIADDLWSEAVKINYNYECKYCGKREYLNSHHLFTRSRRVTKWDIENGMCLCAGCHTMSSNFSAHLTPLEFFEWLEGIKGRQWIDELSKKSRETIKVTPEYLKERIQELRDFIIKYKNGN